MLQASASAGIRPLPPKCSTVNTPSIPTGLGLSASGRHQQSGHLKAAVGSAMLAAGYGVRQRRRTSASASLASASCLVGMRESSTGGRAGRVQRRGLQTGIVGLPNVGKSTLFNALCDTGEALQCCDGTFKVDLHGLLQSRKHVCAGSNPRTGLVRPLGAGATGSLEDHPDLKALNVLISDLLDIYVANGNKHVSYWRLEEDLRWDSDSYQCLRGHFTLPRLLACFSLFDHNFAGQQCALSKRNYAVWGAERVVKEKLKNWQTRIVSPLAEMEFEEPGDPPQEGRFLSFVDVMRHLRWTNDFAPHVGDMLEWAWQIPGLELGLRVSNCAFASREVRWEDKDRSEKGALRALAEHLETRPGSSEHIAALRNSVNWRDYGLGPLEKFVRKYTAWFQITGDRIALCHGKPFQGEQPIDSVKRQVKVNKDQEADSEVEDEASDVEREESKVVYRPPTPHRHEFSLRPEPELSRSACGAASSATAALQCVRRKGKPASETFVRVVQRVHGVGRVARRASPGGVGLVRVARLAYHELCQRQAQAAAGPELGLPPELVRPQPPALGAALEKQLGLEMQSFLQHCGPQSQDLERRCRICGEIQQALRETLESTWPNFSVSMFGTSASGLARRDSDLDLLLDLDGQGNRAVSRGELAALLSECLLPALEAAGARELQSIPNARRLGGKLCFLAMKRMTMVILTLKSGVFNF
ncbi:unnamed protein product [Cladocopium goreaui]|uniref:Uncharacterized protein n=1 Tax=Cladocopium goreaui TaxID=2562237 RepID=A0A9P1C4G5_9DINO|nr:unnamed protein product [Cladocopium goreaui]